MPSRLAVLLDCSTSSVLDADCVFTLGPNLSRASTTLDDTGKGSRIMKVRSPSRCEKQNCKDNTNHSYSYSGVGGKMNPIFRWNFYATQGCYRTLIVNDRQCAKGHAKND